MSDTGMTSGTPATPETSTRRPGHSHLLWQIQRAWGKRVEAGGRKTARPPSSVPSDSVGTLGARSGRPSGPRPCRDLSNPSNYRGEPP
jgi:hypothetical protein